MVARRLIIALVLSLAGSAIFTVWLSKKFSKPAAQNSSEFHYVAAAQNLQAGDVLTPATLKLVAWPTSAPLEGAFPKADGLTGRIVLFPLAAGEPLNERQLAAAGSTAGLSTKIPDGMRAISLRSDQVVGVAGFLLPGTHVDVLVTYRPTNAMNPMNAGESITSTVLQDAQIIATGQKMEPDPQGKPTTTDVVTLLCTPQDAEKLVEASALGTVHFVLRNGSDHVQFPSMPALITQLGSANSAVPRPAAPVRPDVKPVSAPIQSAAPKPYVVEMIYGDKSENVK